jgi:hypothetical protein
MNNMNMNNMNKKKFFIFLLFLATVFIWYNGRTEVAQSETQRRVGTEIVACTTEIPIGEAMQEAWRFDCQLAKSLSIIEQASVQYRKTVKEIASLAKQCAATNCYPNCSGQTSEVLCGSAKGSEIKCGSVAGFRCDGIPNCAQSPCRTEIDDDLNTCTKYCTSYDSCNDIPNCTTGSCRIAIDTKTQTCSKYCAIQSCQAGSCYGNPCQKTNIENKYATLANIAKILENEKATVNQLLDVERPKIQAKLDKARLLFEQNAPTEDLYQLLRGPTTCKIAVNNFWINLEDVQKGLVCKDPYNYLICR